MAGASQGITLITPNSLFGARFNQLDLAVNKTLDIGWGKLRLAFDVYNALNSNSIQNVTNQTTFPLMSYGTLIGSVVTNFALGILPPGFNAALLDN